VAAVPEIPDLEAIRGFLNRHIPGLLVERVELRYPWLVRSVGGLQPLVGHGFVEVTRRGKFLCFEVDDGRLLVVNSMLTGRFSWAQPPERRRPGTCLTLAFAGGDELRYSDGRRMGRWYLVAPDALAEVPQLAELGPDALGVDEETFLVRLQRHRGQIKNTLTNQKFIAGIGNAYSDEILWQAGLHPHRRAATMDEDERRALYAAMQETFQWAIPLLREQVRERLYQRNEEWRAHLRVHRKGGEPCPRCGEPVKAQVRSGRETDYCLRCQPLALA
jgi:formamidopyrimidine-DNA glycosylase